MPALRLSRVTKRTLAGTDAYGKHLLLEFDNDLAVHVHLGLYGTFTEAAVPMPLPVGQVRMRKANPQSLVAAFSVQGNPLVNAANDLRGIFPRKHQNFH